MSNLFFARTLLFFHIHRSRALTLVSLVAALLVFSCIIRSDFIASRFASNSRSTQQLHSSDFNIDTTNSPSSDPLVLDDDSSIFLSSSSSSSPSRKKKSSSSSSSTPLTGHALEFSTFIKSEIASLRLQLAAALQEEKYEVAALIRDKLSLLENSRDQHRHYETPQDLLKHIDRLLEEEKKRRDEEKKSREEELEHREIQTKQQEEINSLKAQLAIQTQQRGAIMDLNHQVQRLHEELTMEKLEHRRAEERLAVGFPSERNGENGKEEGGSEFYHEHHGENREEEHHARDYVETNEFHDGFELNGEPATQLVRVGPFAGADSDGHSLIKNQPETLNEHLEHLILEPEENQQKKEEPNQQKNEQEAPLRANVELPRDEEELLVLVRGSIVPTEIHKSHAGTHGGDLSLDREDLSPSPVAKSPDSPSIPVSSDDESSKVPASKLPGALRLNDPRPFVSMTVVYDFGATGCAGWAVEAINIVLGIYQFIDRFAIIAGEDEWCPGIDPAIVEVLTELQRKDISDWDVDIFLSHKPPSRYPSFPYSGVVYLRKKPLYIIGRSMTEVDRISSEWADAINNEVDEVWVPASSQLPSFVEGGAEGKKLVVVPEPIDTVLYNPNLVRPLPIEGLARFNFLSVFKWEPRKGWPTLISAFLLEFSARDPVTLYIQTYRFGHSNPRDSAGLKRIIRNFADSLDVGDRNLTSRPLPLKNIVVMCDERDTSEMPRLYKAFQAFVLPTRGEGWGLPLMEAMAMGLPTVATNWGGQLEFMNEANSILLPVESWEEAEGVDFDVGQRWAVASVDRLRTVMRRLYEHPTEAFELGRKAAEEIREKFSIERVGLAVLNRLQSVEETVKERRNKRDEGRIKDAERKNQREQAHLRGIKKKEAQKMTAGAEALGRSQDDPAYEAAEAAGARRSGSRSSSSTPLTALSPELGGGGGGWTRKESTDVKQTDSGTKPESSSVSMTKITSTPTSQSSGVKKKGSTNLSSLTRLHKTSTT